MNPSVTVWVKPSCVQCTQVKRMLERLAVPYETLDLTDPAYATQLERFISEGFKSAPITTFRDTVLSQRRNEAALPSSFQPSIDRAIASRICCVISWTCRSGTPCRRTS